MPLLAQALGVTIDELLTDIKVEKNDPGLKEKKIFGLEGTIIDTPDEYEFISDKKTKKNEPYLHIHFGKKLQTINAKARGFIAIGNNAKGIISIGFYSVGLLSLGLVSIGLLAIGFITTLGLVSIAYFALGGIAIGAIAIGLVSVGAIAIGFLSIGAVSIGYYAHTGTGGFAAGKNIFIH